MARLAQLAPNLFVHQGSINVGILRRGRRALLIDFGDGDVESALDKLGIDQVDAVLFTHHHRDQTSGVVLFAGRGTRVGVPAAERACFAEVERYWADPAHRWHLYDFRPHNLMLARSIPVHATYRDGDAVRWGGALISVLETPGHTDGSVSYQVDPDASGGPGRYLFCGDLIYDEGQIWELYSLQRGWGTRDYHGFLGDRKRLVASLKRVQAADAAVLIPSHGKLIADPGRAIDVLCERLAVCYEKYAAISSLRHYFPELFAEFRGPSMGMPIQSGHAYPDFLKHLGTTWIVISEDRSAFALDCGDEEVIREVRRMQDRGDLGQIEWLWITHYHDDHVDAVPQFQRAFDCPVIADESVAQVVENPLAWRLPCISPSVVTVDRHTRSGDVWTWREFKLTAYHLPGQTHYHGGLLVEGHGLRLFFAGDSFTMAGIDDYCPGNRNFLGRGIGFDACVELVQALKPDYVFNCHVDAGFAFTDRECRIMRADLAERYHLYGQLFPWDDPNYGMDEHWVRCHPYEQVATPGGTVQLEVVVTNHSGEGRRVVCQPVLPDQWRTRVASQGMLVAPRSEGHLAFVFGVPRDAERGRWVVPVDVTYHDRRLGQFREAIIVVAD